MTDEELKKRIAEIAEATLRHVKVGGSQVTLEMMAPQTRNLTRAKAQKSATADFRRRLRDRRLLGRFKEQAFTDAALALIMGLLRKQELPGIKAALSAAREKQLELFPGFKDLPTRIRSGHTYLKFPELGVARFLAYEARYQTRAQRNQQTADELHRLALTVKPFEEIDPEMPVATAFDRAQAQPTKLEVVPPKEKKG